MGAKYYEMPWTFTQHPCTEARGNLQSGSGSGVWERDWGCAPEVHPGLYACIGATSPRFRGWYVNMSASDHYNLQHCHLLPFIYLKRVPIMLLVVKGSLTSLNPFVGSAYTGYRPYCNALAIHTVHMIIPYMPTCQ
jgi:hypothetical protein